MRTRLFTLASLAMVAFAANSLFARAALASARADPAAFSMVRLSSGAAFLLLFVAIRDRRLSLSAGSWWSALALFVYAIAFSYAYLQLSAGAGALILFGSVQVTMLVFGWTKGDRFNPMQWAGFALACFGLVVLLSPGATAPSSVGAWLMALGGIAWGAYSLRAGDADPVVTSAGNFVRTLPMCLVLLVFTAKSVHMDRQGMVLALISGIITSGLGYVVWYAVVSQLRVVSASTAQLSVPALAALMGVLVLGEPVTVRLVLADLAILLGIAVVLLARRSASASES